MSLVTRPLVLLLSALAVGCGEHRNMVGAEVDHLRSGSLSDQSAFRLLEGPADSLPDRVRSQLARNLHRGSPGRFEPTHIHHAHTHVGEIWVFFDDSSVCLAQGDRGAVACTDPGHAHLEGVTLGTFTPPSSRLPRPHNFLVVGLVPDRIRQVVLNIGNRRQTLTVRKNLFSVTSSRPILITRLVRGSGR